MGAIKTLLFEQPTLTRLRYLNQCRGFRAGLFVSPTNSRWGRSEKPVRKQSLLLQFRLVTVGVTKYISNKV